MALALFTAGSLPAQTVEADQAYIKAMTATTPAEKARLLKDYLTTYGGKGTQYENFANANICLTAYPGKTDKETIDYGEKALALGGLDDLTKSQILIVLSGTYSKIGQNLEKAKAYGLQVVEIARANKGKESEAASAAQWNQLMGGGYYAAGQAQEKTKDYKGAADSFLNSYNILKNSQILANLKKLGKSLYDAKAYADAEKVLKAVYATSKDYEITVLYAKSIYKLGRNGESLTFFKEAYNKQKSGELAYNIGIILAKDAQANPALASEAIKYLLEASMLYPSQSQQAMQMAESLYFLSNKDLKYNETVTQIQGINKKIDEITKAYNAKFEGKEEDELSDNDKKEMKAMLDSIETEKKNIEKLQASQQVAIAKFNQLIEETKKRLNIK
jgi:hypothetical protein